MQRLLLLTAVLAAPGAAMAQSVNRANGEAGATVLQLTTVPRAAALGGALTASEGIASLFANPAGVGILIGPALHLSGQTLFDGAKAGSAAAGLRLPMLAIAVGAQYLDLGSVDEVVCDGCGGRGTPTGATLSAHELAATGAVALKLRSIASLGAAVNYYATTLATESGTSLSFSAGVRLPASANAKAAAGASIQYVGSEVEVGGYSAPLPRTIRVGAELRPLGGAGPVQLALAGDYVAVRGAPGRIGGGLELGFARPGAGLAVLGRIGYASRAGEDFATQAVSFGGGLVVGRVALDYAYQNSTALGTAMHRFGLTFGR